MLYWYSVIESKNKDYVVGDLVVGNFGWVTRSVCDGSTDQRLRKLDPASPASPTLHWEF